VILQHPVHDVTHEGLEVEVLPCFVIPQLQNLPEVLILLVRDADDGVLVLRSIEVL
jgi:hypothetical protein